MKRLFTFADAQANYDAQVPGSEDEDEVQEQDDREPDDDDFDPDECDRAADRYFGEG